VLFLNLGDQNRKFVKLKGPKMHFNQNKIEHRDYFLQHAINSLTPNIAKEIQTNISLRSTWKKI